MKLVVVLDSELPLGLVANTAAYMGFSMGQRLDNSLAQDAIDAEGRVHLGSSPIPIPILKADKAKLKEIFDKAATIDTITMMDFTDVAQVSRVYSDYIEKIKDVAVKDLNYLGLALYGPKKQVNSLTGSLPLLR